MKNSNIYNSIRAIDVNSECSNDKESKLFLSNKEILAIIMEECVEEFKGMSRKEIIQCIDTDVIVSEVPVNRNEVAISSGKNGINNDCSDDTIGSDRVASNVCSATEPMITGTNTEDHTVTEGTVYFDIKFNVTIPKALDKNNDKDKNADKKSKRTNKQRKNANGKDSDKQLAESNTKSEMHLIINVEAQSRSSLSYPLERRACYYLCRLVSMQYGTIFKKMDYSKLRKVYSIWICTNPRKELRNTIYKIRCIYEELFGNCEDKLNKDAIDLANAIIINLGEHDKIKKETNNLLHTLNIIFSKDTTLSQKFQVLEENNIHDEDKEELKQRIINMGSISYGYFELGKAEGIAEGKAEGKAEGIAEGIAEGKAEATINLHKIGSVPPEVIKESTGFTYEEAVAFLEQTQNTRK